MIFFKTCIVVTFFSITLFANTINEIDESYAKTMQGLSYKEECPISLSDLRIVNIKYLGFDDDIHFGDLIVHKDVAV